MILRCVSWIALVGLTALLSGCNTSPDTAASTEQPDASPRFKLLSAAETGISFQNTLSEGPNTNILMYEYFYNGGGVAIGDFNADGLEDVYFTSNMGDNKLYLNKGSLKFQDITQPSGAGGRPGPWKTGVTTVDINNDGKLDIYLCYSGTMPADKRRNQLFVNQGNDANGVPTFSEQAAQYGIDSQAFSNQGYFFDVDNDGDLDMVLLNHNPKNLPILNESSTAELMKQDSPDMGLRLFKQQNGKFTDVTTQAGISGSALSYGLAVGIADLNNDGWLDFYVSNDYTAPDYLYINNKNGTFSNQLAKQVSYTSQFSMGNDLADINNDGLTDIHTLDMLPEDNRRQKLLLSPDNYGKFDLNVRNGFYYQYMRNMLHLNNGNGTFSEVGQVAGISNTDWSWSALWADYDNDGWKDLHVTNGYVRDYTNLDFIKYMDDFVQQRGRLTREDVLELIKKMPASNVVNYLFKSNRGETFTNKTTAWGLNTPSNSNGAAYADLDNDGDLDLVVNNINQEAFIYQNQTTDGKYLQFKLVGNNTNPQGIGTSIAVYTANGQQHLLQQPTRGYLSSVSNMLHVGLGNAATADSVVVTWPSGQVQRLRNVAANQRLTLKIAEATDAKMLPAASKPLFQAIASPINHVNPSVPYRDFDRQLLLTQQFSTQGPCLAQGDVNKDGLDDIYVGGAAGQAGSLYIQLAAGKFKSMPLPALAADAAFEDAAAVFLDVNRDGHLDLYVASGGYHSLQADNALLQDRLYLNDGKGNLTKSVVTPPSPLVSKSCAVAADVNADGYTDLFVGSRVVPGRYPETPKSVLLLNDKKGGFTAQPLPLGLVTDALWTDLGNDKKPELVVVGEWTPITIMQWNGSQLADKTKDFFTEPLNGWWTRVAASDLNADGKPDLVVGNVGKNTQVRATSSQPVTLHYGDFDKNGNIDPLLSFYIQGKAFPYITREELGQQLPFFQKKYTTFDKYSQATTEELLEADELADAQQLTATELETVCLLSGTNARFTKAILPIQAQYAAVYAIALTDVNHDNLPDIFLAGNNSHWKLRLGPQSANYGMVFLGNGKGQFSYLPQIQSGFALRGDVRSMARLDNLWLFGLHGSSLAAYQNH